MPEETRLPEINQYGGHCSYTGGEGFQQFPSTQFSFGQYSYNQGQGSQCYNTAQKTNDPTWHDMDNQVGLNADILRTSHERGNTVTGVLTEFFGGDVIGPSVLPPVSEPNYYTFTLGSQYGLQSPPPMQET